MARPIWRFAAALSVTALTSSVFAVADDSPASRLEVKHVDGDGKVSVETPTASAPATAAKPSAAAATAGGKAWKKSKLVPFPEDEPQAAAARSSETKAVADKAAAAPKSTFQPRFRPPQVQQAQHVAPASKPQPAAQQVQHVEPVADDAASETAESPAAEGETTEAEPAELLTPSDAEPLDTAPDEQAPADLAQTPRPAATGGKALVNAAFAKSQQAKTDADFTDVIDLCRRGMHAELSREFENYARKLLGWAYNRRGEERAKQGRDKEALADFEAAVEASGSWRAIHNRGVSYAAIGRIQQAMADFDRAIKLNNRYPNAYFNRGELKYQQGDYPAAVRDYTTALKLGPPDAAVLNSRGHALYRMQQFGEALHDFSEAIKLDPESAAALIHRADTYADLGRFADAAKDYNAAVRVAPELGRAYQSTAWFMATCTDAHYRNDKLAISAARKAIELDGPTYRNLSTLAAAQASAGQFDEAKATQEQAIAKAAQSDKVTAEKMMALYQRDVAYREAPRTAFATPEQEEEKTILQASSDLLKRPSPGSNKYPGRQASANGPVKPQSRPNPRQR